MSSSYRIKGLGWLPDPPSFKDFTKDDKKVKEIFSSSSKKTLFSDKAKIPSTTDLRKWCSPIEDQGDIGSCCAHAGVALIEYFEKRAFDDHIDASRMFLYKVTRNLLNWRGDTGSFIRTTMAAITIFGVPPEEYWPYNGVMASNNPNFDEEPPAFCYAFASNYKAIKYIRIDQTFSSTLELLNRIKRLLSNGFPAMFGFSLFKSAENSNKGLIPFPSQKDSLIGGHAVMAVGYDDDLEVKDIQGNKQSDGAILIRNSWGKEWGDGGYGWLPYQYIVSGMALDWWTILKKEWVDTKQFE
jgi:C1A family cysteine protease